MTTKIIQLPVPATSVQSAPVVVPPQTIPVPSVQSSPVSVPAQTVPVPASTLALTINDITSKGVNVAQAGTVLTISDATAPPPPPPPPTKLAAFPGAMGGGASSIGGRGGVVIEVTSLADSGAGSLRAALAASGPRTVIFRTGGIIHPKSRLAVGNPFVTVAGQSAPGGGITLQGDLIASDALIFVSTHDAIIRYLTARIGLGTGHTSGPSTGSSAWELASGSASAVIFDHNSASWWDNKGYISVLNDPSFVIDGVTVQNHLEYEPNAAHPVGPMTDATFGPATAARNQDFHHNLFVNIGHRLPLFNTKSGRWVSNIVFNWEFYALLAQGGSQLDIISNKYVAGNLNDTSIREFLFNLTQSDDDQTKSMPGPGSFYLLGNVGPHNSAITNTPNDVGQQAMSHQGTEGGDGGAGVPSLWFRNAPLPTQDFPIVPTTVDQLDSLTANVGNSRGVDQNGNWFARRDSVDTRIVAQYVARGNGGYFTVVDAAHTVPTIAAGTPYISTLHDGIADAFKQARQLDTSDVSLHNKINPATGYTWLETFLNGNGQ